MMVVVAGAPITRIPVVGAGAVVWLPRGRKAGLLVRGWRLGADDAMRSYPHNMWITLRGWLVLSAGGSGCYCDLADDVLLALAVR